MKKLARYMKERAAHEGVEWQLTEDYLQAYFDRGVRTFFGVQVDGKGVLLADDQQPVFFAKYQHTAKS
jgi:hypothetical protein